MRVQLSTYCKTPYFCTGIISLLDISESMWSWNSNTYKIWALFLPYNVLKFESCSTCSFPVAIINIHFPPSETALWEAQWTYKQREDILLQHQKCAKKTEKKLDIVVWEMLRDEKTKFKSWDDGMMDKAIT